MLANCSPSDFSRTELLIGSEALSRLAKTSVAVIGLGGVGSYAAEVLARAGIGRFILIDFDTVSSSNINRQILALQSTIGKAKTELMKSRILDINPLAEITLHNVFLDSEKPPGTTKGCRIYCGCH